MTAVNLPRPEVRPAPQEESEFGEIVSSQRGERPDYSINNRLGTPSGFTNYTPQEATCVIDWKAKLLEVFKTYGYTGIDTSPVEYAENLQLTGGLDKQIFGVSRLQDGTLTKFGLPFDRTVPMAIYLAKHHLQMTFPYSRYDIDWSWRGETAKAGRYRAFIQADVDTVAPEISALADAQCIVTLIMGLERLGVPKCNVFLNHVDVAKSFLNDVGIPSDKQNDALRAIDKLKPDNEDDVVAELVANVPEINEDTARDLLKSMSYRGPLSGFKFSKETSVEAKAGLAHLREIEKIAQGMGIDTSIFQFAPNLTRGLNYYTGVLFETFMPGREQYGSIASGGRYDKLVEMFNPNLHLKGVGGSIGLTRLFDVMKAENLVDLTKQTTAQVFVGYRTKDELQAAIQVAAALRERGVYTELHLNVPKVKKELKIVDGKGIPFALLVMNQDEIVLKETFKKKTTEKQTDQLTFTSIEDAVAHIERLKNEGLLDRSQKSQTEIEECKEQ